MRRRRRRARTRKRRGRTDDDGGRMLCLYKKGGGREYNIGCEKARVSEGRREGEEGEEEEVHMGSRAHDVMMLLLARLFCFLILPSTHKHIL